MKILPAHQHVVQYYESTITTQRIESQEVTIVDILMELCEGGSVVDLMNQRLPSKFNEKEIWTIFTAACLAVSHLHAQHPPIIHRDIKVENVLLSNNEFKLCDFGSATTRVVNPATESREAMADAEDDILKNTTLAYRAPEMVGVSYLKKIIDTRADVWALGCLLFKLAFFESPFEESGLAIINCNYRIPSHTYSDKVTKLIEFMLVADPEDRPDIFDVLEQLQLITGRQLVPASHANRPKRIPKQNPSLTVNQQLPPQHQTPTHSRQPSNEGVHHPTHSRQPSNEGVHHPTHSRQPSNEGVHHSQPSSALQARLAQRRAQPAPAPLKNMPQAQGHSPNLSPRFTSSVDFSSVEVSMLDPSVMSATSQEESTLDQMTNSLKEIIMYTWVYHTSKGFFECLLKRPLREFSVSLKTIAVWLKLLQVGFPKVATESSEQMPFLTKMHTYWNQQKDKDTERASIICQYCTVLAKKIKFHVTHTEYEGNYSLDTYFHSLERRNMRLNIGTPDSPMNPTICNELLELLSHMENLVIQFLNAATISEQLKAIAVKPVAQDIANAFQILTYLVAAILTVGIVDQNLLNQYAIAFERMKALLFNVEQRFEYSIPQLPQTIPPMGPNHPLPVQPPPSLIPDMVKIAQQHQAKPDFNAGTSEQFPVSFQTQTDLFAQDQPQQPESNLFVQEDKFTAPFDFNQQNDNSVPTQLPKSEPHPMPKQKVWDMISPTPYQTPDQSPNDTPSSSPRIRAPSFRRSPSSDSILPSHPNSPFHVTNSYPAPPVARRVPNPSIPQEQPAVKAMSAFTLLAQDNNLPEEEYYTLSGSSSHSVSPTGSLRSSQDHVFLPPPPVGSTPNKGHRRSKSHVVTQNHDPLF